MPSRYARGDVLYDAPRIHQVEGVVPKLPAADVLRVEICGRVVEVIGVDLRFRVFGGDGQAQLLDEHARNLGSEGAEGLLHMLEVSVDVQMVRVHGRDDGDGGIKLQERTVELVRLGHDGRNVADQKVGSVVLGDAPEEGGAAVAGLRQYVGHQRAGGGLAVRAGYGQALLPARNLAEAQGAFHHPVPMLAHKCKLLIVRRYGGGVYDQGLVRVLRDEPGIVREMHAYALFLQRVRQRRGGAVVSRHLHSLPLEIAGDGAHAYASDAYEIYVLHFSSSL